MCKRSPIEGNWEEKGVIGLRLEIDKNRLVVLWRNTTVLSTEYSLGKTDEGDVVRLCHNGLRYPKDDHDYATVESIVYREGKITFVEHYPLTGDSVTVLSPTLSSRYGDYEIVDREYLPKLRGRWKSVDGELVLRFDKDKLTIGGKVVPVHVLRSGSDGKIYVVDQDPSHYELYGLTRLVYDGKYLSGAAIVYDAPRANYIFEKQEDKS